MVHDQLGQCDRRWHLAVRYVWALSDILSARRDSSTHCLSFFLSTCLAHCTVHAPSDATGTVSIELYFIMTSIWFGTTYYYVFGFLLVVGLLLFITLAEMAITLTYFQLCAEDYNW